MATTRKTKKTVNYEKTAMQLRILIDTAERFRNAYFWSSPSSASSRRYYEQKNSIPEFTWEEGGHSYSAEYTVNCSARNVYAQGRYTKDGKKTTLLAIKNSYERIIALMK